MEEIRELANTSTPLLSELLKLDWEEEETLCDAVSKMVNVPRDAATKQRPKFQTVDHMLLVMLFDVQAK